MQGFSPTGFWVSGLPDGLLGFKLHASQNLVAVRKSEIL